MAPWVLIVTGTIFAALLFLIFGGYYFKRYFAWELEQRRGMNYYGKSLQHRSAFKRTLRINALLLSPIVYLESFLQRNKGGERIASVVYGDVYGPSFSCSEESFREGCEYQPDGKDVFVVTQMRCGTTWMQQIVFQVLTKGKGDFEDGGYKNLYAISPWIEGLNSVRLDRAPRLGASGRTVIKTHLSADLCPYSPDAKYIYVSRNPVSCFASIVDFFHLTTGPFAPSVAEVLDWYCSERMWWRPWPDHVSGWWERSQRDGNVLFISFEHMKENLHGAVQSVANFLGETINREEADRVVLKSSFRFMKENEAFFEMIPPNLFSVSGAYLKSGKIDRHEYVSDKIKSHIRLFCQERLSEKTFPLERFYPDIVEKPNPERN